VWVVAVDSCPTSYSASTQAYLNVPVAGQRSTWPLITAAVIVPQPDPDRHSEDLFVGVRVEGFERQSAFGLWDSLSMVASGLVLVRVDSDLRLFQGALTLWLP